MHSRFGSPARCVLLVVTLLILSVQFPLSLAQSAAPGVTNDVPAAQSLLNLERPGSISGYVLSTHGHDTQNLHVQLLSADGSLLRSVRTDEDGSYGFYPVDAGRYQLRVLDQRGQMLSVENSAALVMDLDDGQRLSGQNLRLAAGPASNAPASAPAGIAQTYQITGVVTAADSGLPLTSAEIDAYALDGTYQGYGYPDAQGRYGIFSIGAGSYKVAFTVCCSGGNYESEWYSGKSDFSSANIVNVTAGAVTGNINASLSVGGHISGSITTADTHVPIPNASVLVIDSQGFAVSGNLADGSGNYVTPGLRTGSYRLRFRAYSPYDRYLRTYYDGKTTFDTADPVSVTAPNTTPNINGRLLLGAQIMGHVSRSDNGQPIQYATAAVYDCLGKSWAVGSTDASGNYSTTVGIPSGMYRVGFISPDPSTFVSQAYSGRPDLLSADWMSVTAPSVVSNIDAVLTKVNGGSITGTITEASSGLPLPGVSVRAFDGTGNGLPLTSSDGAGHYTISGLPTGDYRVGFRSLSYVRQYYNNRPDLLSGDIVHVQAPGVVQNVNAVVAAGATIGGIAAAEGITPTGSVRVRVYDNNGRFVSSALTYNDGSYQTDPVPAGTYRVLFVPPPPDYGYQYYNDKLALNAADGVVVNPPTNKWGVNAALHRGGQIAANLKTQATGYPNWLFVNAFNSSGHIVGGVSGNFSGQYRISALPSGDYRLQIDASAIAPACAGTYMSGYYNFKPDLASADPVHVSAPDITGGINVTLLFRGLFLPSVRR